MVLYLIKFRAKNKILDLTPKKNLMMILKATAKILKTSLIMKLKTL